MFDHHEMDRDAVFMNIVDLHMYHDTALLVKFSRVPASCARAPLCLLSVLVTQTQVSLARFYLEIHGRKVSNAERLNWRQHIKGKASCATRGTAHLCEDLVSLSEQQFVD